MDDIPVNHFEPLIAKSIRELKQRGLDFTNDDLKAASISSIAISLRRLADIAEFFAKELTDGK